MDSTPNVTLPEIGFLPQTLPSGDLFQVLLLLVLLGYIIFSIILFYHWSAYANDKKMITLTYSVYGLTTIPLVLTLITTTLLIN